MQKIEMIRCDRCGFGLPNDMAMDCPMCDIFEEKMQEELELHRELINHELCIESEDLENVNN